MEEAIDAIDDSDDEADYSKMDMGNKKGPLNRWDFEDEEKYQEYMSQREAMPKYVSSMLGIHLLIAPLLLHKLSVLFQGCFPIWS